MCKALSLVLGAILYIATPASAATFSLTQTIVRALADDGTFLTEIPINSSTSGPRIFQIDYAITTSNLQSGELGFALVGFNINLEGVTDVGGGWGPNTATVDSNGAAPGGIVPLFATNVDGGTPGDLQGILTSIAGGVTNAAVDPRANVGKSAPAHIGTIFVRWNAPSYYKISTSGVLFTTNSTTGQFLVPATPAPGSVIQPFPEPSSYMLAALGAAVVLVVRCRFR